MKYTFKTDTEILREIDITRDTPDETLDELKASFDDKPIKKYEIVFKEGVVVKQVHRPEDITDKVVSEMILTIEK